MSPLSQRRPPRPALSLSTLLLPGLLLPGLLLLAACTGPAPRRAPESPTPAQVRAEIERRIPPKVEDRSGWAADIQIAFQAQGIAPEVENICAVLAVLEQESGYVADPAVPGLGRIAREEIDRRAARLHIPRLAVTAALKLKSSDGRSYQQRLDSIRTERQLSELYEELIARVPLGRRLFAQRNPVQTGGPMQVSIAFAQAHAKGYPYPIQGSIRQEVFTRRGGMYFGIAHLLDYQTPYSRKVHRFADYNAGRYASRNAAFQNAVSIASGIPLSLDGDLLRPGAALDAPGLTETAVRSLSPSLGMDARRIRKQLERGNRLDFNDTELYQRVFALADAAHGKPVARALIPGIRLDSPKITRELSTAWFANRVNERYRHCLKR